MGLNLVIFLLWRVKRFEPFLIKYFTASPFKRQSSLPLFPCSSHFSVVQLNLVPCYSRPSVITVKFISCVICMFSGPSVIQLFEFSAKNDSSVTLLSVLSMDFVVYFSSAVFLSGGKCRWTLPLPLRWSVCLLSRCVVFLAQLCLQSGHTDTEYFSRRGSFVLRWNRKEDSRCFSLARSWPWLVLSVPNIPMQNCRLSFFLSSPSRRTQ